MPILFLLFTAVPLIELWLLIELGSKFGLFTTIVVVLGTGIVGAALARWQGWRVLERLQTEMRQGMMPADALGDGALILVAGVLLITPGVMTDAVGLALLLPPVRALVKRAVRRWLANRVQVQTSATWTVDAGDRGTEGPPQRVNSDASARGRGDQIIDARVIESHVVDEDP